MWLACGAPARSNRPNNYLGLTQRYHHLHYQGYVADVWGADTADPESIDPEKVKEALKKLEKAEEVGATQSAGCIRCKQDTI